MKIHLTLELEVSDRIDLEKMHLVPNKCKLLLKDNYFTEYGVRCEIVNHYFGPNREEQTEETNANNISYLDVSGDPNYFMTKRTAGEYSGYGYYLSEAGDLKWKLVRDRLGDLVLVPYLEKQ